jgi:hypothetical protein
MTHTAIVGTMHSGKSTLAHMLVERGYTRMALADPLKDEVCYLLSMFIQDCVNFLPDRWDGLRGKQIPLLIDRQELEDAKSVFRPFLQWFGTEFVRQYLKSDTFWIDHFTERVKAHGQRGPIVCDDVRFPDEADALRNLGFRIIRIKRPEEDRLASIQRSGGGSHQSLSHASESLIEQIRVDTVYFCSDITDIECAARELAGPDVSGRPTPYRGTGDDTTGHDRAA